MNDCIFCRIVRKEIPATVVHENERAVIFLDIKPTNPGHLLIVPKKHFADYASTDEDALRDMAVAAKRMGRALMEALGAPGFNIAVNNGRAANQLVDHVHMHVIPRFEGDGLEPWHGKPYAEGEMQAVADKLKTALS